MIGTGKLGVRERKSEHEENKQKNTEPGVQPYGRWGRVVLLPAEGRTGAMPERLLYQPVLNSELLCFWFLHSLVAVPLICSCWKVNRKAGLDSNGAQLCGKIALVFTTYFDMLYCIQRPDWIAGMTSRYRQEWKGWTRFTQHRINSFHLVNPPSPLNQKREGERDLRGSSRATKACDTHRISKPGHVQWSPSPHPAIPGYLS